jgi:hypothetical protein
LTKNLTTIQPDGNSMRIAIASLLLASVALVAPSHAQQLPTGVSIPTINPTDVVYPGCPMPPTTFGNVWYIDPVNGQTQANGGNGSQAHPWKDLQALFGTKVNGSLVPLPGYTTMLLSTVPHWPQAAGPIQPGDEVLLMSGNYGDISGGGLTVATSQIINSPALTIATAPGQTPVLNSVWLGSVSGFVFNGLTIQSDIEANNSNPLFSVVDGTVSGVNNTNIILENMTVQSDTVANALTWTAAQWQSIPRQGIVLSGTGDGTGLTCISVVNSHVGVTRKWGGAAIEALGNNALIQNNQLDHFANSAIQYDASNVAVLNNNIHDAMNSNDYDGHYAIQGYVGLGAPADNAPESNVYISGNTIVSQIDPAITVAQGLEGIGQNNGDWTNVVFTWNKIATSGCWGLDTGNSHNGIVANNYVIDSLVTAFEPGCNPEIAAVQSHENTPTSQGNPPTNIRLYNNVGPFFGFSGVGVTADHNVATTLARAQYNYNSGRAVVFDGATRGRIKTDTKAGLADIMDGMGVQTNEFTSVPAPGSTPMSPAPNWTLVANSPAAKNRTTPAPPTYPAPPPSARSGTTGWRVAPDHRGD